MLADDLKDGRRRALCADEFCQKLGLVPDKWQAPDVLADFLKILPCIICVRSTFLFTFPSPLNGPANLLLVHTENKHAVPEVQVNLDAFEQLEGHIGLAAIEIVDQNHDTSRVSALAANHLE